MTTKHEQDGAAFFRAAQAEWQRATEKHAPMNSLHEGYAVLLEEVDELWDEVKKQSGARVPGDIYIELTQIAAMAARLATDVVMRNRPNE